MPATKTRATKTRYDRVAIAIHWLTALAILALLVMGFVMTSARPGSPLQFSLFQWHKSVGITVLALTVLRLGWRLSHRAPALPDTMPGLEKLAAHLGHVGLYGLLFALPLSGWAVVSTSPFNIPTVLYGLLPWPHLEFLTAFAPKAAINPVVSEAHELAAWLLIALLVVHIAAALRHHFLIRDTVLTRMLPRFGSETR
ncbi:cytochrome b [Pseudoxanthobacter sp.]|uniref:cytochrome b n=1 Tax=Pseudoxanthobacter sp. TaxID=1925742 RepID=UPI002FE1F7D6